MTWKVLPRSLHSRILGPSIAVLPFAVRSDPLDCFGLKRAGHAEDGGPSRYEGGASIDRLLLARPLNGGFAAPRSAPLGRHLRVPAPARKDKKGSPIVRQHVSNRPQAVRRMAAEVHWAPLAARQPSTSRSRSEERRVGKERRVAE